MVSIPGHVWRSSARSSCATTTLVRASSRTSQHRHTARAYSVAPSATGFNDYESTIRNFKLDVPTHFNFASDVIDRWADKEKTSTIKTTPAFWWIDDDGREIRWSFRELADLSRRVSQILMGPCRLQPGDRILVVLPRVPPWWLLNIAAMRCGLVLIPGTTQLTAKDIRLRLQKSHAKCVITDLTTADKVDQVLHECPEVTARLLVPEDRKSSRSGWLNFYETFESVNSDFKTLRTPSNDPMTIFFTSGTTGDPKMTEHTHASYGLAAHITGRFWLDLVPNDIHWNMSDTGWAKSAWSNLFAPWMQGACVFVHHTSVFDPQRVLQVMAKYPITTFCTAPTAYRMMVLEKLGDYKVNTLRHCVSAGEPLNPEVIGVWQEGTGHIVREGYGQTETVLQCGSFRCIPNKPGSMGRPAPGMPVAIVNEEGREVTPGTEGDIALHLKPQKPVGLFTKYIDEPERTKNSFRGDFYLTGDRAVTDEDGYLWFVGRSDDVITSAGYRIGPFEVESALIEHPSVAESAVVSSPDPVRGAVVKAFVTLKPDYKGMDPEALKKELQRHVKETTAPYKYPRKIEFVDQLPKTFSGKVRRIELREMEWKQK